VGFFDLMRVFFLDFHFVLVKEVFNFQLPIHYAGITLDSDLLGGLLDCILWDFTAAAVVAVAVILGLQTDVV